MVLTKPTNVFRLVQVVPMEIIIQEYAWIDVSLNILNLLGWTETTTFASKSVLMAIMLITKLVFAKQTVQLVLLLTIRQEDAYMTALLSPHPILFWLMVQANVFITVLLVLTLHKCRSAV